MVNCRLWSLTIVAAMENESKREMLPKKDEWFLVEEKIFPLQSSQGAISKEKTKNPLRSLASGTNHLEETRQIMMVPSSNEHVNECRVQTTSRRPRELISIDNVSLVTSRQGKKLPYGHTISAPLPARSPARISPWTVSPDRGPRSAPVQHFPFVFQWPSVQEEPNSKEVSKATNGTESNMHLPHPPLQRATPREKKPSVLHQRHKGLSKLQKAENSPIFPQDCLLSRRRLKNSNANKVTPFFMGQNSPRAESSLSRNPAVESREIPPPGFQGSRSNRTQSSADDRVQPEKERVKRNRFITNPSSHGRSMNGFSPVSRLSMPTALSYSRHLRASLQHTTETKPDKKNNF